MQRTMRHPATAEAAAKAAAVGLAVGARVVAAAQTDQIAGSVDGKEPAVEADKVARDVEGREEIAVKTVVIEEAIAVGTTTARMGIAAEAAVARKERTVAVTSPRAAGTAFAA